MNELLHRWRWRRSAVARLRAKAIDNICPKCRHTRWINLGWHSVDAVGCVTEIRWRCASCGWVE